jgi:hypothetical protein
MWLIDGLKVAVYSRDTNRNFQISDWCKWYGDKFFPFCSGKDVKHNIFNFFSGCRQAMMALEAKYD